MDELLEQRIKEYRLAVAFAKEFMAELGREKTLDVIGRAFQKIQAESAAELVEKLGSNSVEALAGYYRRRAAKVDNLKVIEVADDRIALNISRCRAWEAFQCLGAPEICQQYCESDHAFIRAFNPLMSLVRTKLLSKGADHCDHQWVLNQ